MANSNQIHEYTSEEKLIRVFKIDEPYELAYRFRSRFGKRALAADKHALESLMKKGLVQLVEKTNKTILYKYMGQ